MPDLSELTRELENGQDPSSGKSLTLTDRITASALLELVILNKRQLHYLAGIDRELKQRRTHRRFNLFRRKAKP